MTKGLPGSGKSYWARQEVILQKLAGRKAEIVCKDDIRKDLTKTGWEWSKEREVDVIRMRDALIKSAFTRGVNVVISADTNFGKHEVRLQQIAKEVGAKFEVKDFTNVPLAVCIERDEKRPEGEKVGPEVIKRMYNENIALQGQAYIPDPYATKALIVDLDGTLAIHQNRGPFDFQKCNTDLLNEPVASIVRLFSASGYSILYTSGREDSCRDKTIQWIKDKGLPLVGEINRLLMRKSKDNRKDNIVKLEIFDEQIRHRYNVQFVLDDRDQVVKMWRSLGLTCLQVAEGNF